MLQQVALRDYAAAVVLMAAVFTAVGVIYRLVVRPIAHAAQRELELFEWMHDQFDAREGDGGLREQMDRIEQRLDEIEHRMGEE